jgi:hypothetical protein
MVLCFLTWELAFGRFEETLKLSMAGASSRTNIMMQWFKCFIEDIGLSIFSDIEQEILQYPLIIFHFCYIYHSDEVTLFLLIQLNSPAFLPSPPSPGFPHPLLLPARYLESPQHPHSLPSRRPPRCRQSHHLKDWV